jgi:uncharacterized damage-inducible protein DinB
VDKREELIRKLREVRSLLLTTTLGLKDKELTQELITDKWALKDILGHVASWEEEFIRVIQKFLREENPEYDYLIKEENNWSEWNLSQWEKKREWSYKTTLEKFSSVHEEFIALIKNLKVEDLAVRKSGSWGSESTIEEIILSQIDHEIEHCRQIVEWRQKKNR